MDPITQGLLGASAALAIRKKEATPKQTRTLYVAGFLSGMLADIDVLIRSSTDPLLMLEYHRAFTHSLAFIPIGGAMAYALLRPLFKRLDGLTITSKELFWACILGYATHAPLDALTNYGTSLFLPFSETRISLNLMAVVDPFFSFPLITISIWGLVKNKALMRSMLYGWMALVFIFNFSNRMIAKNKIEEIARGRGHIQEELLVKPTLLNGYLWRSVYRYQDRYYIDAIFALPGRVKTYTGGDLPVFEQERDYPEVAPGSTADLDFKRFSFFSDNMIAFKDGALVDVRFSPLPQGTSALWSVRPQADHSKHVLYEINRPTDGPQRRILWKMMLGQHLDPEDNKLL